MSRYQGVDPGRGASKVRGGGGQGPTHRAEHHSGKVDDHHLQGAAVAWLGHLERQPHHQLHQGVEHDVLHVDMDELIGEEPPGLLTSLWVVDEKGTDGSLTSQDLLSDEAGDVVTVPYVEYNLQDNYNNQDNVLATQRLKIGA